MMWTQIYDDKGVALKGMWNRFKNSIRKSHQPIVRIEFLDSDLRPIGSSIKSDPEGEVQNVVSDGSIDVDVDRGTRRTGELTLLNPESEFTPVTEGFESEGPWVGKIYINRVIRIWRGVKIGDLELYVPVGTFLVDGAEVIVEQNMSLVNLTLSDFWKKLTKSYMPGNRKYVKGTHYNTIIRNLISSAGIPLTGSNAAAISALWARDTDDRKIQKDIQFKRGESRGEILYDITDKWKIDAYFDPMGRFRTDDRKNPKDQSVIWDFISQDIDQYGNHGGLVSLTRSFNDDNLYNHVIVIGTGNEKKVVKAEKTNTSTGKYNIYDIGDRVFYKESEHISTQAEADEALRKIWDKRIQFSETLNLETICNPALEGDDMIRIAEFDYAKVDDRYRIRRMTVPLVTSKQNIEATNILRKDDIE